MTARATQANATAPLGADPALVVMAAPRAPEISRQGRAIGAPPQAGMRLDSKSPGRTLVAKTSRAGSAQRCAGAERPKRSRIFARDSLDWYVEPVWVTELLLGAETFLGAVWDPACGGGNVLRALTAADYAAIGTDVVDRGAPHFAGIRDFLTCAAAGLAPNLVFNAPFYRAEGTEAFIRHALTLVHPEIGKVAAFVDLKFLASARRAGGLYAEHPPARIHVLGRRPSCPPGEMLAAGGKASGGTADWCWLVWDGTGPRRGTQLGWLA